MGSLTIGLVHNPVLGEAHAGDEYVVIDRGDYVLIAVADGLGHGPEARDAACKAVREIERHAERTPQALVELCHTALRGTRGAVLAIVRIDRAQRTLTHSGLGNIESRILGVEKVRRPVTLNGIVGHSARKFRQETFPFEPGDMLIMHSDGISDRFDLSPASRSRDPQMLANQLVQQYGHAHDDQIMLIVRWEPTP